ncbi:SAF domain-containing protein [Jatrophihabitans sp. GAS493]|uniref:SAF domain-containing protein n=1 Tax=Jatrophihabitans sp. GAS493 TaxID=1907575 RepID=UPI000BB99E15|nr:SAF domain-containing protein [Jatrophihabitans sp. GAS493]SOD72950.1 SAF domain-containing protein [Jatrophihabitans sp. GAS493]
MSSPGPRTMTMPTPGVNGHRPAPSQLGSPLSTRHRPKGYAALAVALIVGLGALGYYFYTTAGTKVPVVVAVHEIPAGHSIARSDLTTVEVAGDVTAVAGANLPSLVGQTAAVEILPNTLVQRAMVTSVSPLASSQAMVGVAVAPGQMPSIGLSPGQSVDVLQLPSKGTSVPDASSPPASVLAPAAVVYDVRSNPSVAGGALLTLLVPKSASYGIEAASNSGLVAVVTVSG